MTNIFPYFMAIMGLLFFLPPLFVIFYKIGFRFGCEKAEGLMLRIERNRDPDSGSMMIQPVFEFWNANGKRVEHRTGVGYGLRYLPKVGSKVKIYYRPNSQPLRAQVASRGLWEVSGVLMLTGLVLMAPAIVTFFLG